jgi:perosamine synthetase
MAYLALNIGPGDEVIVPGFGFMAAANVALHVGATPRFTEVDQDSWCMRAVDVEKAITSRTKAIVPIHTYGNVCEMGPIMELADKHGVRVIEDAAEAIGSRYQDRSAGTIGDIGIYSFHATKTITTGEGGAAVTANAAICDRMRLFRSHGMSSRRYWHEVAGHNFRLTNLQAALGCAQLENISRIVSERQRVYQTYVALLTSMDGIVLQQFSSRVAPVVWAFAIRLDSSAFPQGRDAVIDQLSELGIETRPGFYSAQAMPHLYGPVETPICEDLSREIISLPSSPSLTHEDIEYVCKSFRSCKR